eukprot:m.58830 g.58830  ORF g.58830 m.58830 type:complete len:614 (+) comp34835_c0_seq1:1589-3430(+)
MSGVSEQELVEIRAQFDEFDADKNGHITCAEIAEVMKALGESVPGYQIRDMVREVDIDENGTIEFNEFIEMFKKVKGKRPKYKLEAVADKQKKLMKSGGTSDASATGTTHSFAEEEALAFVDWINFQLSDDPDLAEVLPIKGDDHLALFPALHNGILLCKLINKSVADTVDERTINKTKLNLYNIHENQTLALNSASAIGCNIVNIGPEDLTKGTPHLCLGILWQVIRIGLLAKISLQNCPGLARLLEEGEELEDLLRLSPEEILLRWFNYHLKEAGSSRRVKNFGGDIKDSECYTILMNQIAPPDKGVNMSPMHESNMEERAEKMLQQADKLNCRAFVRPKDVVRGNQKLNLAFVANLFTNFPALEPLEDQPEIEIEESREEKTYRNWMNSLGVKPFVYWLYDDLADGLVLLQLFDKVFPGSVDWKKVNEPPFKARDMMKKLENCNYAVQVAKNCKLSVVGIGGEDILSRNKTLTLAIVWQIMRAYTISILQKLSGSDKPIQDAQIVEWVNSTLSGADKSSQITSFKDPTIATALPVIDLVDSIKPSSVKYDLVNPGQTEEDKLLNAKYAISMSRKIGARVFALPEDIMEVNPKMLLTVFACLMARGLEAKK